MKLKNGDQFVCLEDMDGVWRTIELNADASKMDIEVFGLGHCIDIPNEHLYHGSACIYTDKPIDVDEAVHWYTIHAAYMREFFGSGEPSNAPAIISANPGSIVYTIENAEARISV